MPSDELLILCVFKYFLTVCVILVLGVLIGNVVQQLTEWWFNDQRMRDYTYTRANNWVPRSIDDYINNSINTAIMWSLDDDLSKSIWVTDPQAYKLLLGDLEPEKTATLEEIIDKSDSFPIKFPVQTVRCKELQKLLPKEKLETYINSAYPVMHEKALQLCAQFLMHKTGPAGSEVEKELYKDMNVVQLVDRLLTKRAASFLKKNDGYMLRDGTKGGGNWESIGTDSEVPPLVLKDYISYDEMKLGALLSVSSYTHFINIGCRENEGEYSMYREDIADEGVVVGLTGPRLAKKHVMDYQEIIHDREQNGQQSFFLDLFQEPPVKYSELRYMSEAEMTKERNRFTEFKPGRFFDNYVYTKRLLLSLDVLLHEANAKAKAKGTTAFVYIVGIGTGILASSKHNNKIANVVIKRIEQIGKYLPNVSDVCLPERNVSYNIRDSHKFISIDGHPEGGIRMLEYDTYYLPNAKLEYENEGKLSVVSFGWNGNALPGNEFWKGCLRETSGSSTACATQISELCNPYINPKVCASNLRIVTVDGIVPYAEYTDRVIAARESNNKDDEFDIIMY